MASAFAPTIGITSSPAVAVVEASLFGRSARRKTSGGCSLLAMVQEGSKVDSSLPVIFLPVSDGTEFVNTSTNLNVQFITETICLKSTIWQVNNASEPQYLIFGRRKREPGSYFKLEEYSGGDYKFIHYLTNRDVGLFLDGGKR
ncbi:miraculin-like [Zingiber officinale]|uniref:miraculin-like n=1 Tax=Zingiber officinale TaxID=94328 RepID=UPI001C4D9BDA|nr:miraculin-like [Zingiber officinale]